MEMMNWVFLAGALLEFGIGVYELITKKSIDKNKYNKNSFEEVAATIPKEALGFIIAAIGLAAIGTGKTIFGTESMISFYVEIVGFVMLTAGTILSISAGKNLKN